MKNNTSPKELIQHILEELRTKSLDYKLIVNATTVANDTTETNALTVGCLWDDNTDGFHSVKTPVEGATVVVTVFYVKL